MARGPDLVCRTVLSGQLSQLVTGSWGAWPVQHDILQISGSLDPDGHCYWWQEGEWGLCRYSTCLPQCCLIPLSYPPAVWSLTLATAHWMPTASPGLGPTAAAAGSTDLAWEELPLFKSGPRWVWHPCMNYFYASINGADLTPGADSTFCSQLGKKPPASSTEGTGRGDVRALGNSLSCRRWVRWRMGKWPTVSPFKQVKRRTQRTTDQLASSQCPGSYWSIP